MKRVALAVMIAMVLLPGVALAGSSTDAALGLGAFAVFNQILSGTGIFGAVHPVAPAPVVVQRPVIIQQPVVVAAPPAPVYAPAPVYVPAPPVYVPAPPVYVAPPPPVYVVPAPPVYVAPAPVIVAPRPVFVHPGHRRVVVYERARFGHEWHRH